MWLVEWNVNWCRHGHYSKSVSVPTRSTVMRPCGPLRLQKTFRPLHTNHQQITTQRRNPLADSHKHWMRWRLECLWFIVWWCARSWGPGTEHPHWHKRGISFTSYVGRVPPKQLLRLRVVAIANMVSLAYGKDPTQQRYDRRKLRSHLFVSMERKKFSPFPTLATRKVKKSVKKTHRIPVYCVCRFPDTHTLYMICDGCNLISIQAV